MSDTQELPVTPAPGPGPGDVYEERHEDGHVTKLTVARVTGEGSSPDDLVIWTDYTYTKLKDVLSNPAFVRVRHADPVVFYAAPNGDPSSPRVEVSHNTIRAYRAGHIDAVWETEVSSREVALQLANVIVNFAREALRLGTY